MLNFGQDIGWVSLTKIGYLWTLRLGNKGMLPCDGTTQPKSPRAYLTS